MQIDGGMYSGKTGMAYKLLREWENLAKKHRLKRHKGVIFKTAFDNRGSSDTVTIHTLSPNDSNHPYIEVPAVPIESMEHGVEYISDHEDIGVGIFDEGHFIKGMHEESYERLIGMGILVLSTYLDKNFRGEDFCMPNKEETTNSIRKLTERRSANKHIALFGFCDLSGCLIPASYSQRLLSDGSPAPRDSKTLVVGGKNVDSKHEVSYITVCEYHFRPPV